LPLWKQLVTQKQLFLLLAAEVLTRSGMDRQTAWAFR
jgi:hypothetical protein